MALALIVLGPKKLPEAARSIGKLFVQVKRAVNDAKHTVENEIDLVNSAEAKPSAASQDPQTPKEKSGDSDSETIPRSHD